jgi:hypothetical protein
MEEKEKEKSIKDFLENFVKVVSGIPFGVVIMEITNGWNFLYIVIFNSIFYTIYYSILDKIIKKVTYFIKKK